MAVSSPPVGSIEKGKPVTLSWDPNTEEDLAGYKIHYGTTSGVYDIDKDVGNVVSFSIDSLDVGTTYFLVVSAYDFSGNESGFSDEVSTIPVPKKVEPDTTAAKKWNIAFKRTPGGLDSLIVLEVVAHGNETASGNGWTIWGHGQGTDSGLFILNPEQLKINVQFEANIIGSGICLDDPRLIRIEDIHYEIETAPKTIEFISNAETIFINYFDDCFIQDVSDSNLRIENLKIWR